MEVISIKYEVVNTLKDKCMKKYKFTEDERCFNTKTGKELNKKWNNGVVGYNLLGRFYSMKQIREMMEEI